MCPTEGPPEGSISIADAANLLGVGVRRMRAIISQHSLLRAWRGPHGTHYLYRDHVEALAAARAKEPPALPPSRELPLLRRRVLLLEKQLVELRAVSGLLPYREAPVAAGELLAAHAKCVARLSSSKVWHVQETQDWLRVLASATAADWRTLATSLPPQEAPPWLVALRALSVHAFLPRSLRPQILATDRCVRGAALELLGPDAFRH